MIDSDGVPPASQQIGGLGAQATADVYRRAGLTEPAAGFGGQQLGRGIAEVPPAVHTIEVRTIIYPRVVCLHVGQSGRADNPPP